MTMTTTEPNDAEGAAEDDAVQARIARRAFELSLTDGESSPDENWLRAEREVRGEAAGA